MRPGNQPVSAAPRSGGIFPSNAGSTQDMGGRVTRYPLRGTEKTPEGRHRDIQLGERWMDAMSVDYSCLFPTGMLTLGLHPQKEMEAELCWAYNRWLTEVVLPDAGKGFTVRGPNGTETVGAIELKRSSAIEGGIARFVSETRSLAPEIPAADAEAATRTMRRLAGDDSLIRAPK